jgi:hypothetical protein
MFYICLLRRGARSPAVSLLFLTDGAGQEREEAARTEVTISPSVSETQLRPVHFFPEPEAGEQCDGDVMFREQSLSQVMRYEL